MLRVLPLAVLLVVLAAAPARAAVDVTIHRDPFGVPHVTSSTFDGVAYGTGYAVARDRPFLLSAIRVTAQGRSAELLGPGSLEADIVQRRDFYDADDVRRQYDRLPPGIKRDLQAFADGVNAGWAEVLADPDERPALWDALGYTPEPWVPTDSVSVTALFTYSTFAGEGGVGQLRNAALLSRLEQRLGAQGGRRAWDDLLWRNDPRAPSVIPRGEGTPARRSITQERPGREQLALARRLGPVLEQAAERRAAESRRVAKAIERLPIPRIGSYAVAVDGRRTRSGGGLLLGAPQAGFTAPPVFWQLGQHSPGRDCTGFTVPGLGPYVGVGWCNGHAWSLVAGNAGEQVDTYVEELHPDDPDRYRHKGEFRRMTVRRETFRVNRCLPPVCATPSPARTEVREFRDTVHGPVVDRRPEHRIAFTQRRAQRGVWAQSLETVAGWNTARSLAEFDAATDRANGTYNVMYADRDGHVLYRFSGLQPVRAAGFDRRLPSPGTGRAEWRGMLPARAMPRVADPRSGILVANQGIESKPAAWWPNSSSVHLGQASRVRQNRILVRRAGTLDLAGMRSLNPTLLERSDGITPIFERAIRSALRGADDPRLQQAAAIFDRWARAGYPRRDDDGDGRYDDPAIAIFGADVINIPTKRHLWRDLLDRVFGDELGQEVGSSSEGGTYQAPGTGLGQMSTLKLALERSARRRERRSDGRVLRLRTDFVDDRTTPRRERADEVVRASIAAALRALETEYGTADMEQWTVPLQTIHFSALGVASVPPLTRSYDHGTYSLIVDPKAGAGEHIMPPGNLAADSASRTAAALAGRPPAHFDDQREVYERYEMIPMRHLREEHTREAESVTTLTYGGS